MDYVVDSVLPMHTVDSLPFKLLVQRLTGTYDLLPHCRQTFVKQVRVELSKV